MQTIDDLQHKNSNQNNKITKHHLSSYDTDKQAQQSRSSKQASKPLI